jgi:hypothetical protein
MSLDDRLQKTCLHRLLEERTATERRRDFGRAHTILCGRDVTFTHSSEGINRVYPFVKENRSCQVYKKV